MWGPLVSERKEIKRARCALGGSNSGSAGAVRCGTDQLGWATLVEKKRFAGILKQTWKWTSPAMELTAALARAVGCGVAPVVLALGKVCHGGGRLQPRRWRPKWRPGWTAVAGRRGLCEELRRASGRRLPAARKKKRKALRDAP